MAPYPFQRRGIPRHTKDALKSMGTPGKEPYVPFPASRDPQRPREVLQICGYPFPVWQIRGYPFLVWQICGYPFLSRQIRGYPISKCKSAATPSGTPKSARTPFTISGYPRPVLGDVLSPTKHGRAPANRKKSSNFQWISTPQVADFAYFGGLRGLAGACGGLPGLPGLVGLVGGRWGAGGLKQSGLIELISTYG